MQCTSHILNLSQGMIPINYGGHLHSSRYWATISEHNRKTGAWQRSNCIEINNACSLFTCTRKWLFYTATNITRGSTTLVRVLDPTSQSIHHGHCSTVTTDNTSWSLLHSHHDNTPRTLHSHHWQYTMVTATQSPLTIHHGHYYTVSPWKYTMVITQSPLTTYQGHCYTATMKIHHDHQWQHTMVTTLTTRHGHLTVTNGQPIT